MLNMTKICTAAALMNAHEENYTMSECFLNKILQSVTPCIKCNNIASAISKVLI